MAVYNCRLCDLAYHDGMDVIGIFSDDGKSSKIAAKILYTTTIMVTENDQASQNICKVCWSQVDCFTRFLNKCNATNDKNTKSFLSSKREELLKLLKTPIHLLFKCNKDLQAVYDLLVHYSKNKSSPNQRSTIEEGQLLLRQISTNTLNSNTYAILSENNAAIANEMPRNSLVNGNTRSYKVYSCHGTLRNKAKRNENSTYRNFMNKKDHTIVVTNTGPNHLKFVKKYVKTNEVNKNHLNIPNSSSRKKIYNRDSNNTTSNGIIVNNEVICLDDDDDNDDGVNNNDNHYTVNGVKAVNKWIINPNKNNNQSSASNSKDHPRGSSKNSGKRKQKQPALPVIGNQISLLSPSTSTNNLIGLTTNDNVPPRSASRSSNYSTEEISVTPDINPLNISDALSFVNQPAVNTTARLFYLRPEPVVPDNTGVHFLSSLYTFEPPTVDLTNTDDTMELQPRVAKNKRKSTKNIKISIPPAKKKCLELIPTIYNTSNTISQTPLVKNRATNVNTKKFRLIRPKPISPVNKIKKSKTQKLLGLLGPLPDLDGWKVHVTHLSVLKFQCSICFKLYASEKSRLRHELNHTLPSISDCSNVDLDCSNEANTEEQQMFLLNFNLIKVNKQMSNKIDPIKILIRNKNILNALTKFGCRIGSFFCNICKYKTRRLCTLWAHNKVNHSNENITELNANITCCICDRMLNKRTQILKHVDKCLIKPAAEQSECEGKKNEDKQGNKEKDHLPQGSFVGDYFCYRCKTYINSCQVFNKHLMECA